MKKIILVILMTASGLFAFTDSGDTGSTEQRVLRLQHRMDSIETEFQKLKIEKSDNSPGATGEIRKWGKGLYLGGHLDFLITDIEIGYMFKRKHCRIGAATGLILNDIIGTRSNYEINRPASWYCGFNLGTPVFLNFFSLIGYSKILCLIKNDGGQINQFFGNGIYLKAQGYGLGFGGDMEFWLKKNWNFTLGPEADLIVMGNSGTVFNSGTRFGLKHYF